MRYSFRKIGGLLISRDDIYNRDSPIDKGGLCILQSACITRCVYTERERGAREFTRHAPSGQPRMRTATRDVPNDVAVWNDEWRPEDEKQGDAGRVCRAKSSRECAEWLAVSRRLAYRRVSLHSEVSCRCGLTGSPCSLPFLPLSATPFIPLLRYRSIFGGGAHRTHRVLLPIRHRVHDTAYPLMN